VCTKKHRLAESKYLRQKFILLFLIFIVCRGDILTQEFQISRENIDPFKSYEGSCKKFEKRN